LDKIKFLLKGPLCTDSNRQNRNKLKTNNSLADPTTSERVTIFKLLRFSLRVNIGLRYILLT